MTVRPSKRPDYASKRNSPKCVPSYCLLFRLVVLFSALYNANKLASSQKRDGSNVSQSTESAYSGVVNDIQIRSNESDQATIVDDKTFSKVKGKRQMNNNTKINDSLNLVGKREVNYFENDTIEKPKTILCEADNKKRTQDIPDDRKRFHDLLMGTIFKANSRNNFRKINRLISSKRNDDKKNIDPWLCEENPILAYFFQQKKWYQKYLQVMCSQGKQTKWAEHALRNLGLEKAARNCQDPKLNLIFPWKDDEVNKDENSAIDTILYVGCVLIVFAILTLNLLYLFLQVIKPGNSTFLLRNTLKHSRSSKIFVMALGLLLSRAPVGSDVTVSTQGTYFQNHAPGRYLEGHVYESFIVSTLLECQMKCDTFHSICMSLNYIENEGTNICEINNETQYCALPGEFIVKENSFYVETMPENNNAGYCSICGYRGVIKKTKETPGFMCLCKNPFYGDRCQYKHLDELSSSVILRRGQNYLLKLKEYLPVKSTWKICYRATKDGWAGSTFHSRCDEKGPTVTIVRVQDYVFGGYTNISWGGSSVWRSSSSSFIFSLKNKNNLQPFKAPVYQNHGYVIYSDNSYGPTFGAAHDLYISNNANSNTNSYTNLGGTYQPPSGYSSGKSNTQALLAGTYNFSPSEVEVFYLR